VQLDPPLVSCRASVMPYSLDGPGVKRRPRPIAGALSIPGGTPKMTRRRSPWFVGLFLCAALIAGCGSSSSSTTTSTTAPAATATSSTSGTAVPPANVAAAVAQCKQEIQAQPTLSSTAKTKLEGVCEEAAKGNGEAVKKAAREVCEEVIKSSPVPAGAAQEQALAACRTK